MIVISARWSRRAAPDDDFAPALSIVNGLATRALGILIVVSCILFADVLFPVYEMSPELFN